jgi:tripartite motif-containing protein 71
MSKTCHCWNHSLWILLTAVVLTACGILRPGKGLERPNGVAVADDGTLYVMDFGNFRILHLRQDGQVLQSFGTFGQGEKQIFYGWDLAIDQRNNLYFGNVVRDNEGTQHDGVKVFSPQGEFIREIGAQDYGSAPTKEANLPYGVEVDQQNRVYVADYGTKQVRIFNKEGKLLATLQGEGQDGFSFTNPGDVAIDDRRSLMYITDFTMGKLLQFKLSFNVDGSPQITFLQSIGNYGRGQGQLAFPQNLSVEDETGIVYVGDMANRRIQAFNADGSFQAEYKPSGVQDWQVLGIYASSDGKIFSADALNHLIWIFSSDDQTGSSKRIEVKP